MPGSHRDVKGVSVRSTVRATSRHTNESVVVRAKRAGKEPSLGQDLEAVADAEHEAALGGEVGHRLHHR